MESGQHIIPRRHVINGRMNMKYSAIHISNTVNAARVHCITSTGTVTPMHSIPLLSRWTGYNFIIRRWSATVRYCRQDRQRKFIPRRRNKYLIGTGRGRAIDRRLMSRSKPASGKMTVAESIDSSSRSVEIRPVIRFASHIYSLYCMQICLTQAGTLWGGHATIFIWRWLSVYRHLYASQKNCAFIFATTLSNKELFDNFWHITYIAE